MKRNGLGDELLDLRPSFGCRDTSRQVRDVGAVARRTFLDDNRVPHRYSSANPACFQMLLRVLTGTSTPSLPATVTRPGLAACLNCRCPPFDRIRYHPV